MRHFRPSRINILQGFVLAGACLIAVALRADDVPETSAVLPDNIRSLVAPPAQIGLDKRALADIDQHLDGLAEQGVRSGYVAMLARHGRIGHWSAAGFADRENGRPMSLETSFRIASMTKPVTAVAVMQLVEQGGINLDDNVSAYLPRFANMLVATSPGAASDGNISTVELHTPMTIRHLLTHTSGLGYVFDYGTDLGKRYVARSLYEGDGDLDARVDRLPDLPLYFQPGARWQYSYANDVLGRVIEVVSGQTLEQYMRKQIFDPLNMTRTTFYPDASEQARVANVYSHTEAGEIVSVFSDEQPETPPTWPAGGSGLVSTAGDYMRFALMLAGGGQLEGVTILKPETVALMTRNHVAPDKFPDSMQGFGYGLGVGMVLAPAPGADAMGVVGDYGWGGYFDTDFFVSPSTGLTALILTQEQPGPNRPGGSARELFATLAYAALLENAQQTADISAE